MSVHLSWEYESNIWYYKITWRNLNDYEQDKREKAIVEKNKSDGVFVNKFTGIPEIFINKSKTNYKL